jgi:hypothetical protein
MIELCPVLSANLDICVQVMRTRVINLRTFVPGLHRFSKVVDPHPASFGALVRIVEVVVLTIE